MACDGILIAARSFQDTCLIDRDPGCAPASWGGSFGGFLPLAFSVPSIPFLFRPGAHHFTVLPFISLALAPTSANPVKTQRRQDPVYLLLLNSTLLID